MKPQKEKVILPEGTSFKIYRRTEDRYDFIWHIHPEYEIVCIYEGFGKRYVGNSVEEYSAPEVVFIPPGVPHTWESDPQSKSNDACVLHFREDCLGNSWFDHNEFKRIGNLLQGGSAWHIKDKADAIFDRAVNNTPLIRVAAFIELLDWINNSEKKSLGNYVLEKQGSNPRLEKILNFINKNLTAKFSVSQLADKMSMSPYQVRSLFQKHLGKSILQYTNEMRVFEACKLMQNHDMSISSVADSAGFNNLSYFNRNFLKVTGMTPREYRQLFC